MTSDCRGPPYTNYRMRQNTQRNWIRRVSVHEEESRREVIGEKWMKGKVNSKTFWGITSCVNAPLILCKEGGGESNKR